MQKKVYKRLNDSTVLCIYQYNNRLGWRCHNITIYYEDTDVNVEFGTYILDKKGSNRHVIDTYSYNNNYIIGYKYCWEQKWLKVDRLYDIDNRCDMLTGEKFEDYFNCVNVEDKIKKNKCKVLGKHKKIN